MAGKNEATINTNPKKAKTYLDLLETGVGVMVGEGIAQAGNISQNQIVKIGAPVAPTAVGLGLCAVKNKHAKKIGVGMALIGTINLAKNIFNAVKGKVGLGDPLKNAGNSVPQIPGSLEDIFGAF